MKIHAVILTLFFSLAAWSAAPCIAAPKSHPRAQPKAAAPAPAPLLPAPPLFSATYSVQADGFKVGEMHRAVKALGNDTYLVETRVFTTGLVSLFKPDEYVERSTLRVTPEGYLPLEFSSRYTGRSKDVTERLRFDWDNLLVRSLRDNRETEVKIEPGVLDKLMYQVVMQYDLARGETHFRYRVADRSKIEKYEMDVVGEEPVKTPIGTEHAVKVKKGTTMIWCAKSLDFIPVKLEQQEDGHTVATYITTFKREPAPALSSTTVSLP